MASDETSSPPGVASKPSDLVAFVTKELDADAERQAKLQAASNGELPSESHAGATLDLSHRGIRALPVEIVALIKDRVERLALSHNPQIALPSQIVQCERLRYLNIRWNQLKTFPPEIIGLRNLEILDLSKNKITELPEDIKMLTSLKFLAIARNRITRLPLALGDMTKLQKMIFDDNPIEFPPLESIKPDLSVPTADKERDVCQQVKRFMRLESMRDKLRTKSEEDLSGNTQETPRASLRSTGGRFPIRPSNAGLERFTESKMPTALEERIGSPSTQRAHVRDPSNTLPMLTVKRPAVAPLSTSGTDTTRSRSETASSASLRSRRQGFVPSRKATGDLPVVKDSMESSASEITTAKKPYWHELGQSRDRVGSLSMNSGDNSSEPTSPATASLRELDSSRAFENVQKTPLSQEPSNQSILRAAQRLHSIFAGLHNPIRDAIVSTTARTPPSYQLDLVGAKDQTNALGDHLEIVRSKIHGMGQDPIDAKSIFVIATRTLRHYSKLAQDLRRNSRDMVHFTDAIYLRAIMLQLHGAIVELRNICSLLGFRVKNNTTRETGRTSQAWSNRTVTPTQPSRISSRRMRGATILRSIATDSSLRAMPPPSLPMTAQSSRTNTMTSSTPLTARSGESFSSFSSRAPSLSRSNTLRSTTDESDNDQQFEKVFLALKHAGETAALNLPALRAEILTRKERAQSEGQSIAARDWDRALTLYEAVMTHDSAVLKRLKAIRLNDPGVRNQVDFWQLCDKFVQSWAELVSHLKILTSRRVDIGHIKSLMRNVQKAMKEVTSTVSQSPLYQQAVIGQRGTAELGSTQGIAFPSHGSTISQSNNYITPVPATPLSAALGPAALATLANMPNGHPPPPAPPTTARMVHERVDTLMLPPASHTKRP